MVVVVFFLEMQRDVNGNDAVLSNDIVNFTIDKLMAFIDAKYSMYRWDEIEDICKAAVVLFPSIELVSSNEIKNGVVWIKIRCVESYVRGVVCA